MDSMKEPIELPEEETETGFQSTLKNWLRKKKMLVGIAAAISCVLIAGYVVSLRNVRPKDTPPQNEARQVYQEKDIRRALKEAGKDNARQEQAAGPVKQEKRNYGTDIAVYLEEPQKALAAKPVTGKRNEGKLGLPSGTKIPAFLSGTLFSYNVAAPVTAVVSKEIKKEEAVLIPKGSQFLGEAGVLKSLNRINIQFDRLILPDGKEVRVRAMALSEDGSAGIKGKVDKYRDKKVLKSIGETMLAGASLFTGPRGEPFAMEDQLRLNLTQNLTQQARQDLRDVKVETSITVESQTPVLIILLEGI